MKQRYHTFIDTVLLRLSEQSTWQGIGFLVTIMGAKWAVGLDWGQAAGLGGMVSAVLKMIFPDPK